MAEQPDIFHGPEARAVAAVADQAWAAAVEEFEHLLGVLREHRAGGSCPGSWCPGSLYEEHVQAAQRFELEAWLQVAAVRLLDREREEGGRVGG